MSSTPLSQLRALMAERGFAACLLPTADPHGSEWVAPHYAARAHFSGFTGSAGTLLVLPDWAGLWTDGRYHLQAEKQLAGSGITLLRAGLPETPTTERILLEKLSPGDTLAVDGRCLSVVQGLLLRKKLAAGGLRLESRCDLPAQVWPERPPLVFQPIWALPEVYAGLSRAEKLRALRETMSKNKASSLLLTALEDIAWLTNLRGGDLPCCPVFFSYALIDAESARLFLSPEALTPALRDALTADGFTLFPYADIERQLAALPEDETLWLDPRQCNLALFSACKRGQKTLRRAVPTLLSRSKKNPVEIENMKLAHRKDGLALTRFLLLCKARAGDPAFTECSAAQALETLRQADPDYLGPSFPPILAYGPHGAIVHYNATAESDVPLRPHGFLLADTGGHYWQGTTDCTRTIALGALTEEQKQHYTAVLAGNLSLMDAVFPRGTTGPNLDILARRALWAKGLDYDHGTGHGVGYLLNVHEGPQGIRQRSLPQGDTPLQAGMITSNEPGCYRAGAYGIRLENLLLCVEKTELETPGFLGFIPLTLVPFEREAILPTELSPRELALLNAYHRQVYESLAPLLSPQETEALAALTAPLSVPSEPPAQPL